MLKNIKLRLKKILPVQGIEPPYKSNNTGRIITLSLQRSGQHAVINWLCAQLQNVVHFNHCHFERTNLTFKIIPVNNRIIVYKENEKNDSGLQSREAANSFLSKIDSYERLLYSFEDIDPDNTLLNNYIRNSDPTVILIIRDPYNWLASSLKHGQSSQKQLATKKDIIVKYLEQALEITDHIKHPVVTINFNDWATNILYRKNIMAKLSLPFSESADNALQEVPDFGGGSSFDETKSNTSNSKMNVFDRWRDYADDPVFRKLLDEKYLNELTESFFQIKSPF